MHQEKQLLIDNIELSKKRMLDMDEESSKINLQKIQMEEEKVKQDQNLKDLRSQQESL